MCRDPEMGIETLVEKLKKEQASDKVLAPPLVD